MSWNVITAGPSAGKTSTVRALSARGYNTIPEAARLVIEQAISDGYPREAIRDSSEFQLRIEVQDRLMEAEAARHEPTILDRSMADSFAYRKLAGKEVPNGLIEDARGRYDNVFLLDLLDFEDDGVRMEEQEEAESIHEALREAYEYLGYEVTEVPVMPIDQRADYIEGVIDGDVDGDVFGEVSLQS